MPSSDDDSDSEMNQSDPDLPLIDLTKLSSVELRHVEPKAVTAKPSIQCETNHCYATRLHRPQPLLYQLLLNQPLPGRCHLLLSMIHMNMEILGKTCSEGWGNVDGE